MLLKILFFIFIASKCAESANILGVFPMPGISHYILASKLMKGLAEAGHNVTMISPYKLKDSPKNGKFTDILLEGMVEEFQARLAIFNLFDMNKGSFLNQMISMTEMLTFLTNNTLQSPNVKKLLQSNSNFDAVVMEQFDNDALKIFSHIYDCPLITLSSMGPNSMVNPTVGNPQAASCVPEMFLGEFGEMSFFSRFKNMFMYITGYLFRRYYLLPIQDEVMTKAVPNSPSIYDLYTNVSLVLLNSHTSINQAVPVVPNMVEIGGYFIDPPKKLPKDLQDFLDSAKEGVVYFSMGSNLKSKDIPAEKKKAILNVLGKLKQKVLWKFEEDLPEKPSNIMIRKWLPQQDILAHPNIKLFITHGGLLSSMETIYHGVPILAIPVFGDQPANALKAEAGGYALKLGYHDPDFTEERLGALVNELLTNPKYKENVQRRSKVYHDRPQKPMETATYWVDYVIRHRGAPHLRVSGIRMPWYQYFLVDVLGVIVLGVLITIYTIKFVFRKIFCIDTKSTKSSKKKRE